MFKKIQDTPSTFTGKVIKGSAALFVLVGLLAFHGAVNIWWLGQDNHVHWLDEQVHLEQTRAHYEALFLSPDKSLPERLWTAFSIKPGNPAHPPLLYFCGAVAQGVMGYGTDFATLINTAAFLLLLVGVFLIARRFMPRMGALFVTTVASFTPGLAVCSRYYMTDYLAACIVVWAFYALIRSEYFHNTRWSVLFGLLNALALLTRTVTPIYYLVPLMITVWVGFLRCLGGGFMKDTSRRSFGHWCVHLFVVGVITVVIAAPWYMHHENSFLGYWIGQRGENMQPFAFSSLLPKTLTQAAVEKNAPPAVTPAPEYPTPPESRIVSPPEEQPVASHIPWTRYPIHAINNGTFLVPFVLALLGALLCLLLVARQGWSACLMLLAWTFGSWFLFTVLFKIGTPRYAIPALAPLALFSALPLLAVSNPELRRTLCGLYLAILAVPWVNLTFFSAPDVLIPWRPDPQMLDSYDENGVYLSKNRLTMGNAYSWLGVPVRESYQDRMFFAMLREETKVNRPEGQNSSYAVLNLRGFGFQDKHFWPDPNPFRRHDLPTDIAGVKSRISLSAHARNLEELETSLPSVNYVIYALEEGRVSEEEGWKKWLTDRDFRELDSFSESRRATIPGYHFGVWARASQAANSKIASKEEINKLGIVPLLRACSTAGAINDPELMKAAQVHLSALLAEADKTAAPLTRELELTAFDVEQKGDGISKLNFVFRVVKPADKDYVVILRGILADEADTPFRPVPSTKEWAVGSYMLITHEVRTAEPPVSIKLSLSSDGSSSPWATLLWPIK